MKSAGEGFFALLPAFRPAPMSNLSSNRRRAGQPRTVAFAGGVAHIRGKPG
jgi:hypothetical protein